MDTRPTTCPFHVGDPLPCAMCEIEDEIGDERRAAVSVAAARRRQYGPAER